MTVGKMISIGLLLILCCSGVYSSQNEIFDLNNEVLQKFLSNYEENLMESNIGEGKNLICQRDLALFLKKLTTELWAIQMADANGKLISGIARGNLNSFGSFAECLNINAVTHAVFDFKIRGKYCLSYIPLFNLSSSTMKRNTLMPNLDSRISNIILDTNTLVYRMGLCLPASCTASDIQSFVSNLIESQLKIPGITVHLADDRCYTSEGLPWTVGDWIVIALLSLAVVVTLSSTLYDLWFIFYSENDLKNKNQILASFSLYTNTKKLVKTSDPGKLSCIYGIRVLTISWIILGHRFFITGSSALENFFDFSDWLETLSSSIVVCSTVSVDTFFLMSGFLLAYTFFQKYDKIKGFNIFMFYFHRFLRLSPALAVVIMIQATILKHMGNGPVWFMGKAFSQVCVDNWWSSLLYVQNYVNPNEQCINHGWYLAVDMQLYILSPILLIPLIWKPKVGIAWTTFCTIASIVVVIVLATVKNWDAAIFAQTNDDLLNNYYFATHSRAAPWLIGIISGYIISTSRKTPKLNKLVVIVGWVCCLAILGAVILGGHSIEDANHVNTKLENVTYLAFSRPAWALAVLWIIVTCYYGYGGPVNWFLSLNIFQILARLTYSVYLIHLTMQFTILFSQKTTGLFSIPSVLHSFAGDTIISVILAYFLCIMFESPILNLERILFGGIKKKTVPQDIQENQIVLPSTNKLYEKF